MTAGLAFEGVAVSLGGSEVLRDVSFALQPGEVAGLLGRNGAGKTTLLRTAVRGIAPERGRVTLDGADVAAASRRELAQRIAVVPQDLHVPFPFLVSELVLMGRSPHQPAFGFESADDVAVARDAMEEMGVAHLADRTIDGLSGGERQLVLFARALAQQPQYLLLDEPTAFLDLRHRIDVLRAVRRLAEQGRGVLVVSHDLGLAARASDRLLLLDGGEIAHAGPPDEVLRGDALRRAFGIEADVVTAPDGSSVVVPRIADSPGEPTG